MKHPLNDLTNLLHRPVETATQLSHTVSDLLDRKHPFEQCMSGHYHIFPCHEITY